MGVDIDLNQDQDDNITPEETETRIDIMKLNSKIKDGTGYNNNMDKVLENMLVSTEHEAADILKMNKKSRKIQRTINVAKAVQSMQLPDSKSAIEKAVESL